MKWKLSSRKIGLCICCTIRKTLDGTVSAPQQRQRHLRVYVSKDSSITTAWLGETYYYKCVERLGVVSKVQKLMMLCNGVALDTNSKFLQTLGLFFQSRNALAHPKSREFKLDRLHEYVTPHPSQFSVGEHMKLLERVIDGFCALDKGFSRTHEFSKNDM